MNSYAQRVAAHTVVQSCLLSAVACPVFTRHLHGLRERREHFHHINMGARFGEGKIAAVGLEEQGGFLITTLTEEIGFAYGFIGKAGFKGGNWRRSHTKRQEQSAGDAREVVHGENLKESIRQRRGVCLTKKMLTPVRRRAELQSIRHWKKLLPRAS